MTARKTWADFIRNQATEYFLNYDWIRVDCFYDWLNNDELEWSDSSHGIKVWIEK